MCRSSSTPNGRARRRRSCRTRSPIRSPPKCFRCREAKVVRGYSFYGFSFVYVIFEDGTDPYWARSRVLEYLSGLSGAIAQECHAVARTRCHRRGLGVHVFAQFDQSRSGRVALDAGLVSALSTGFGGRRVGSRFGRRVREAIPGHGRSRPNCAPTTFPSPTSAWPSSAAMAKSAGVRLNCRKRNSFCACEATSRSLDDLRKVAVGVGDKGVPILLRQVANVQVRARHAPRHCRAEWRRGNGRRHRGRALRRQRPPGHSGCEEAARPGDERPAGGRAPTRSLTTAAR